jgi:hypothetical protein
MAQPRPPNSTEDDLLQIIKAQQVTITQLIHLANEQIEIIGKLVSEPSQRAAVVTGLQARLAQTSKT